MKGEIKKHTSAQQLFGINEQTPCIASMSQLKQ
jgi:hypothetical protein